MPYKLIQESPLHCLECGNEMPQGRKGRIYCSIKCRNKHHNNELSRIRSIRSGVIRLLDANYSILEDCLKMGMTNVEIQRLTLMGFNENCVTSWRKRRNIVECMCFDICYVQTPSKLLKIRRLSDGLRER